jgi:membrane-associated phospholipid phosphatase
MLAQTLIYSGSLYYTIAIVAGRSRPFTRVGAHEFDFWQFDNESQSFPSGHTVVAFSVATVLASRIDHWAASVLLYGAAAGVALARMYQDFHWSSDVFLGAVIGYSAGKFVQNREDVRHGGSDAATRWSVHPTGNGFAFQLTF